MCSDITLDRSTEKKEYRTYIKDWFSGFKELANGILESEKRLYIIAISRKMPRFFSWLRKREDFYGIEGLGVILDKAEYTTEHALPFIFGEKDDEDYEVIVVDDSMVYGNTMRRVSKDVVLYTGGKLPYVSIIVGSRDVYLGLIKSQYSQIGTFTSVKEVSAWMDYVSRCNAASELPVDVEFPILHIQHASINEYRSQIESQFPESERYELRRPNTVRSINLLLDKDYIELTAIDFAKSRCFFAEDEVRLVVISPLAVQHDSLLKDSHFNTEILKASWTKIKDYAAIKDSYRTQNSLVVMLNYLHSINTLSRNWDTIIPSDEKDCRLENSDLTLLVGSRLSQILLAELNLYLTQEYKETYRIVRTGLPSLYAAPELESPYSIQRDMIAADQRNDKNVNVLVTNLFDQTRFDRSILGQNVTMFHRMHSSFFESFDSLKELIHSVFDVDNLDREVNETVDMLIDAGKIIPKYVTVVNSLGKMYWRRFFTSAHSSVEL